MTTICIVIDGHFTWLHVTERQMTLSEATLKLYEHYTLLKMLLLYWSMRWFSSPIRVYVCVCKVGSSVGLCLWEWRLDEMTDCLHLEGYGADWRVFFFQRRYDFRCYVLVTVLRLVLTIFAFLYLHNFFLPQSLPTVGHSCFHPCYNSSQSFINHSVIRHYMVWPTFYCFTLCSLNYWLRFN
jgi:hypothetical protein